MVIEFWFWLNKVVWNPYWTKWMEFIISQERDIELSKEAQRQEENDKLRKDFAKHANAFHHWITETRSTSHYIVTNVIYYIFFYQWLHSFCFLFISSHIFALCSWFCCFEFILSVFLFHDVAVLHTVRPFDVYFTAYNRMWLLDGLIWFCTSWIMGIFYFYLGIPFCIACKHLEWIIHLFIFHWCSCYRIFRSSMMEGSGTLEAQLEATKVNNPTIVLKALIYSTS